MIRITVSHGHPVTIAATGEPQFHFARLLSASENVLCLQLRKPLFDVSSLKVRTATIETFAQLGDVRAGAVGIEIDCRNISSSQDRLLKLAIQEPPALTLRIISDRD